METQPGQTAAQVGFSACGNWTISTSDFERAVGATLRVLNPREPYYYLRIDTQEKHPYVIFGGLDHQTGQATDTRFLLR